MSGTTASVQLAELDSLDFHVLINDEIDQISPSLNCNVRHAQSFAGVPLDEVADPSSRGGAKMEMPMHNICCGAHGLSLFITAKLGTQERTLLFDAGPEAGFLEMNAERMRLNMSDIDVIFLSHWHRDHSGGLLSAISLANKDKPSHAKVTVDVHPDRPDFRGIMFREPISLQADPTFAEIEAKGGELSLSSQPKTVLGNMFMISGSVPRQTDYEGGIPGGIRYMSSKGAWEPDELISEERFVMCKIKGKGLVIFTGCSHAGLINIAKHAKSLDDSPIYAIIGGYHLADASNEKMRRTMDDLKQLEPSILMPGHCTGWRFKLLIEHEMPGQMAPIFGGTKYEVV
ncbi:Zn(2)-C6 fungal-type domain-containing protein [Trichoderma simmonsii]|uniref:Zn(2)-C6 fungal-type domain-containing protein n=1 Tax=Trichoderma simmonsii TaxID=1491479 RepID=A0A8G0LQU5_9HYPO|nr:hypothetical protein Trihar35433_7813 [Trichoderma harzianum]QYT06452.1 Zn(2)-C6 fungal-type domain-containing protein [Trichoderma simmonsii]